jgi:DNA polymerase-3 subunit epsilon
MRDALIELTRRLDGAVFTAHNAAFDAQFLERAARRARVPLRLTPRLCTLRLSRRLDPDREVAHGLADLCERYGVALDRPHDARSDALATAAVLPHLLSAHGVASATDLEPLYDRDGTAQAVGVEPIDPLYDLR